MANFSNGLKLKTVKGKDGSHQIPLSSSKWVVGNYDGVYFFWKGLWNFTAINRCYVNVKLSDVVAGSYFNHVQHKGKLK